MAHACGDKHQRRQLVLLPDFSARLGLESPSHVLVDKNNVHASGWNWTKILPAGKLPTAGVSRRNARLSGDRHILLKSSLHDSGVVYDCGLMSKALPPAITKPFFCQDTAKIRFDHASYGQRSRKMSGCLKPGSPFPYAERVESNLDRKEAAYGMSMIVCDSKRSEREQLMDLARQCLEEKEVEAEVTGAARIGRSWTAW